jgi:hypothetical protein
MSQKSSRQLIIGLGSGRSGTTSLSRLLNIQPSSFFLHEGSFDRGDFLLPWEKDIDLMDRFFEILEDESSEAKFYGCVALFFLPYVEDIIKKYPNVKFIRLIRDRSAVVRSFLTHSGNYNWWENHDGTYWKHDPVWDREFPKFNAVSKEEAIGKYWDFYNQQGLILQEKYPENFKIFNMENLNSRTGMNEIFDFVGYPSIGRIFKIVHTNSAYTPLRTIKRWAEYFGLGIIYRFIKNLIYLN